MYKVLYPTTKILLVSTLILAQSARARETETQSSLEAKLIAQSIQKDFISSKRTATILINAFPASVIGWRELASLAMREGKPEESRAILTRSLKLNVVEKQLYISYLFQSQNAAKPAVSIALL